MGGGTKGIGGNNKERKDLRLDTEAKESDAAGLSLEEKGLGASSTANMQDPRNPANFISTAPSSQDIKDEHDSAKPSTASGTDPLAQQKQYNDAMAGAVGRDGNSMYAKARAKADATNPNSQEARARRAANQALLIAVNSIADIQNMQQFEAYYANMSAELDVLETETEVARRDLDEVTSELDDRIQALRDQINEDQNILVTLEPGSEERIQLAIKIRTAEHTLELYELEREELTNQWNEHSGNLENAQQRMADIQRQIDAGASGEDLERLKAELQEAQNAITTANTSLDNLEHRIEFSEQMLEQSMSVQQIMSEDNSYELFTIEQQRAQAELAQYFLEVRQDGQMSVEELQRMQELQAAGGIDEAGLQRLENMEGEDAEKAARLAAELRAAQNETIARLAGSGIGIQEIDPETGETTGNLLYGEAAVTQLSCLVNRTTENVQAETTQRAAVEQTVVNPITNELSERINTLQESRANQAGNLAFLAETEEVQATDELITLFSERRDKLFNDFETYENEVTQAQEALAQAQEDLANLSEDDDPNAVSLRLEEAQKSLDNAIASRNDIVTQTEALEDTLTATEGLMQDFKANESQCNALGIGHSQLAQAEMAKALIERTDLTVEQRQELMQQAGNAAYEDNRFVIGDLELSQIIPPPPILENINVPEGEVIGSADQVGDKTNWSADETLDLGTSEADMLASQRIAAQIENGEITADQLNQALSGLDVDRDAIERQLAEQGVQILEPENDGVEVTNSIFVDGAEPEEAQMASYRILGPAGPNAIQVPHTPVAERKVEPEDIAPASYASFADNEFKDSGPPLAGADTPINNRAPETGTGPTAFASALSSTTPTQSAAQTGSGSGGQGPATPTSTADAAAAIAQRNKELHLAELQEQQNTGGTNLGGAPGAGGSGAGGQSMA